MSWNFCYNLQYADGVVLLGLNWKPKTRITKHIGSKPNLALSVTVSGLGKIAYSNLHPL